MRRVPGCKVSPICYSANRRGFESHASDTECILSDAGCKLAPIRTRIVVVRLKGLLWYE